MSGRNVAGAAMQIVVQHAPPFRRWHRRLGKRLVGASHGVRFVAVGAPVRRHGWLLATERRLYRVAPDLFAREPPPSGADGPADLTILLVGAVGAGRVIEPWFAGVTGEGAMLDALRAGDAQVRVMGGEIGALRELAEGRAALEDPTVLSRAIEHVLPRLVTLLAQGVARLGEDVDPPLRSAAERGRGTAGGGGGGGRASPSPSESAPAFDSSGGGPLAHGPPPPLRGGGCAFLARGVVRKLGRRFGAAAGRPDHWRVALRVGADAGWKASAFTMLPEDRRCFRADPFPFEHGGRRWIVYEEYPYATGRGVIGRVELLADGTIGEPKVVLEQPVHLSYPLLLRHGAEIYMLPEMSAARRVQLFRAAPFPDRWEPDAVLIEGAALADATPVQHDGRWWLFATTNHDGGSSWDQLALWHAPDLLGPWLPHPGNPVLIDAGSARPAGAMWHEDGVLMRVAQDCRKGYGDGLAICRVDRLDGDGYAQTVVRRLPPPSGSAASGVHTLNRAAGLEVIDLKTRHP